MCAILRATQTVQSLKLIFLQLRTGLARVRPASPPRPCSVLCRFGRVAGPRRALRQSKAPKRRAYDLRLQWVTDGKNQMRDVIYLRIQRNESQHGRALEFESNAPLHALAISLEIPPRVS